MTKEETVPPSQAQTFFPFQIIGGRTTKVARKMTGRVVSLARHHTHARARLASLRTGEVVVLLAVAVGERHQLAEQQRVLEDPLHRLDQVRLQRGRVLLVGVPSVQELLEGPVRLG